MSTATMLTYWCDCCRKKIPGEGPDEQVMPKEAGFLVVEFQDGTPETYDSNNVDWTMLCVECRGLTKDFFHMMSQRKRGNAS